MREQGTSPSDDRDGLEPQLLDLLRDVSEYAAAIGEATLADTSLSLASSGLLLAICEHPGITIAELSRRIPKTQQTIGQVVARLHRLELVERRLGDGRGIGLHPTPSGRRLAKQAHAREQSIEHQLREILGMRRHERLVTLLNESRSALRDARERQHRT